MARRMPDAAVTIRRPTPKGKPLQDAHRLLRRATSHWRALPDFLIIGAQKAGTTSLYDYLQTSPYIRSALTKEVHYFDLNHDRGANWYRAHFPLEGAKRTWITGESSPYYLLHPTVPALVHAMLPDVRLIAILRHPVDRAYSHFHHSRAYGIESESDFVTALELEPERTNVAWRALERGVHDDRVEWFSYARRSQYAPQLRRWLRLYPPEALLVVTTEELSSNPTDVLRRAFSHLGVEGPGQLPELVVSNSRAYGPLAARLRGSLCALFASDIVEVEELIGRSTGWC